MPEKNFPNNIWRLEVSQNANEDRESGRSERRSPLENGAIFHLNRKASRNFGTRQLLKIKKRSLFFIIMLCALFSLSRPFTLVYAAQTTPNENEVSIIVSDSYLQYRPTAERLLFLYGSGRLDYRHDGNIYLIFSNLEINSEVNADIYSYFSNVMIGENGVVNGVIYTLSSRVVTNNGVNTAVKVLVGSFSVFQNITAETNSTVYDDTIHYIQLLLSAAQIALVYVITAIKKSFIEQSAMTLYHEPLNIIRNGLITYFVILVMIIILITTLFLSPFAILLLLAVLIALGAGEAALALIVGYTIIESINAYVFNNSRLPFHLPLSRTLSSRLLAGGSGLRPSSTSCILIGVIIIEALRNIPFIGWTFTFLFFPIIALGMISVAFINGFVRKHFYPSVWLDE